MEQFIDDLLAINPKYDIELISRAYHKAEEMHEGQLRKSGEPYLIHPVAVAKILAELGMDEQTIVAGLLHDVVEDTPYPKEDLAKEFGEEIMLLVDGVTKLGSIVFESKEERQAENLRKMFLAMSKDIRVLIIKLADRLHNLRTINYMSENKILDKCKETLEIYAPLASRLGIYSLKFELEDIALKYLDSESYYYLVKTVNAKKNEREAVINQVITEIRESLDDLKIHYDITGRSKHFYSIYKKMKYQNKQIDEIFDLTAIRIIVDTVRDCYAVLGIVHTMWKPIPGRFKDYIAMPKPNMYQSLHTTVIGDNGNPFEIQIRTYDMHKIAELGIAAHWKYKEGIASKEINKEEVKLAWLRQTLEWQKEVNDPKEFMETLKVDLFASQVFVFTPGGDVIELPAGSTPLDFAFKIHSAVGYKCVGAKVNGKMVPIDHKLENGNIVEIVTSANSKGPSADWLKIAQSSHAKSKIRNWLKKENKSDSAEKGKELLEKYVRKKGYDPTHVLKNSHINKLTKNLGISSAEDFYTQASYGGAFLAKAAVTLIGYYHEEKQEELKKSENDIKNLNITDRKKKVNKDRSQAGVSVKGVDNLLIRFSRCCNPVPGDEIIGFITKGRGISVHRKDCVNVLSLPAEERNRFIEVEWDANEENQSYNVDICILSEDRKGLFSDLSKVCEDMDVHITGVNAKSAKDEIVNITMTLSISNTNQMQKVLRSLRNVPGVADVYRAII
ncbi:bifunctional (p)ppGpp synthetase/guanosine-3',5'-bis(diphosphate) 3'-pyrophosphohydrolase [Clostridium aminobutyricum]|uniref:GTP diphosphokinase n=2 Tax=Clostridium aminobutyricum TaxID=33953 RepID=A0A939IGS7_CLOAM|nr:bifunctional (p)ppGpp synthetase/guanosine-3',5'-bis(diphosphate) 3'-pyrophosphohydrolase [Clostridium aminobutyricum]MBN7772437.1 bifunctional (p)ppGpp synthetase/guanosine-3',5'-bis(diphosphate) 3'-pyrophosphohydrolase [Clostridium aminobutyricum]